MVAPLFAANDLGSFVIIAIAAIVSLISAAVKNRQQQAEREKVRPRNRQAPEGQQEPAKELERFLNELTDQRKKNQKAQPPVRKKPVDTRAQQRQQKTTRQPSAPVRPTREPETTRGSQVLHRHLSSSLDQRHADSMHSELEKKHLKSEVIGRHLSSMDSGMTLSTMKRSSERPDAPLADLVPRDSNEFARAFVMSQIFGTPVGLQ